jgi:2-succinyl-6-hydroxy-2,4-cyclohexadiene-1-carboxylate synthase
VTRHAPHPVLLHGFAGSSAAWGDAIVDGLAALGPAPALVDLPGHGRNAGDTDRDPVTLEGTLDLVSAAAPAPFDLVGYSLGARVALHFAAAHPDRVRRLVLESGSPGLADAGERAARRQADEGLARRIVEIGVEAFLDEWEAQPLFETRRALPDGVRERQRALRSLNDAGSLAAALRGLGTGTLPSLWERLSGVHVPTLLVVGALDRKFVDIAERTAAAMPNARVVVVPDAGHTVHLERPADWVAAVGGFLGA